MGSSLVVALAAVTALCSDANAQPRPQESDANEILVTATKRERSISDVAVSVSRIDPESLEVAQLHDSPSLQFQTTGVNFTQGATALSSSFVIRGVTTYATSDAIGQSVAVVTDGIAHTRPSDQITQMIDIDHIEILRGPQGTLFGANATAGVIQIVTAAPERERFLALNLGAATGGERSATIVANSALGDAAAIRGVVWAIERDGFIDAPNQDRPLGDLNDTGARLRFRADIGPATRVDLTMDRARRDSRGGAVTHRAYLGYGFSSLLQTRDLANGISAGPDNDASAADGVFYDRYRASAHTAHLQHQTTDAIFTSISGLRETRLANAFDADYTDSGPGAPNIYLNLYQANTRQFSQELRIESPPSTRLDYVVGVYGEWGEVNSHHDQAATGLAPFPLARQTVIDLETSSVALFGEASVEFAADWRVLVGGRISEDRIRGSLVRTIPPTGTSIPNGPFGALDVYAQESEIMTAWRVGVQRRIQPGLDAYVTVSRGYKAAGLNFTNDTQHLASPRR